MLYILAYRLTLEFTVHVPHISVCVCVTEVNLELGKQKTPKKSSSIWLTSPRLIKEALWVETRNLCRYVTIETAHTKGRPKKTKKLYLGKVWMEYFKVIETERK